MPKFSRDELNKLFGELGMPMATKWTDSRMLDKLKNLPELIDEDTDPGDYQDLLEQVLKAVNENEEIELEEGSSAGKKSSKKSSKAKEVVEEEADDEDEKPAKKKTSKKSAKKADEEEDDEEEEDKKPAKKSSSKKAVKKSDDDDDDDDEDDDEPKSKKSSSKKSSSKKAVKKSDDDDDDDDDDEDDEPVKKKSSSKKKSKSEAFKGPGVIASIAEIVSAATKKKPVTKDQILEQLTEKFPDRSSDSMMKTINVQIPNRLKKEKGLNIKKAENGGYYCVKSED